MCLCLCLSVCLCVCLYIYFCVFVKAYSTYFIIHTSNVHSLHPYLVILNYLIQMLQLHVHTHKLKPKKGRLTYLNNFYSVFHSSSMEIRQDFMKLRKFLFKNYLDQVLM